MPPHKTTNVYHLYCMDGERKTIHYLIRGDYELNQLSCNNLQHKYAVSRDTVYMALKGKTKTRRIAVLTEEKGET